MTRKERYLLHESATILYNISVEKDGYTERDGAGFNKYDLKFGRSLVNSSPDEWSEYQVYSAYRMLHKYRKQLLRFDIDIKGIDKPSKPEPRPKPISIDSIAYDEHEVELNEDGVLVFRFPRSQKSTSIRRDIKKLTRSRFDWDSTSWHVRLSPDDAEDIVDIIEKYGFNTTQEALDQLAIHAVLPKRFITADDESFVVQFAYNGAIINDLRSFPQSKYDKKISAWRVSFDLENISPLLSLTDKFGFELDSNVIGLSNKIIKQATESIRTSRAKGTDKSLDLQDLMGTPYPFQEVGILYGLEKKKLIIGDDCGLGKTVQALSIAHLSNSYPVVVVCPASVKINWCRELHSWIPDVTVGMLSGTSGEPVEKPIMIQTRTEKKEVWINHWDVDIMVVNYDILTAYEKDIINFAPKSVIFDEIHYIKNPSAKRSKVAMKIAKATEYAIGLSATPMKNRPKELVHPLATLGLIHHFGDGWKFKQRYCNMVKTPFGWDDTGASNLSELNRRLRQYGFIRRLKKDVLTELPPVTKSLVPLEIDNRSAYESAIENPEDYLDRYAKDMAEDLGDLYDGEIIGLNINSPENHLVKLSLLRQIAVAGKIKSTIKWIKEFTAEGEPLVVFAVHKRVQKALVKAFPGCAYIVGEDSAQKRDVHIQRFQNDDDCNLIICSLQAAAEGITLTKASNVAFVQLGWTPADLIQATARIHRIGQSADVVNMYVLEAVDTVETDIHNLVLRKMEILEESLDGDEGKETLLLEELTKELKAIQV